ncbi:hypothetical protein PF010_g23013 [Phytophthora fragariae]|uniref:Uncharacterized protein n=2 Tax=Phytophthora TaxID=4783 RepID=A0A6G0K7D2_9STRA|nr:hypothetical protein PR001_g21023 [Phytophthora rubi]KAE9078779.1 hypothetical protein PF010_g23013 [Phytophthora fragariae]KAE9299559.1 hypothetical protein PF008_g23217 [Phytophthora fragariae]KAE9313329.1 hypothetical protein PR003_g19525 [Phytophthora rubi]
MALDSDRSLLVALEVTLCMLRCEFPRLSGEDSSLCSTVITAAVSR